MCPRYCTQLRFLDSNHPSRHPYPIPSHPRYEVHFSAPRLTEAERGKASLRVTFTLPDGSTVAVDGFFDKDHLGDRSMGVLPTSSFLARCYCGQVCTYAFCATKQHACLMGWSQS